MFENIFIDLLPILMKITDKRINKNLFVSFQTNKPDDSATPIINHTITSFRMCYDNIKAHFRKERKQLKIYTTF